ncbi:TlpA family protein disulfide reductase [Maribacter antarcticus]|uniref:TlpA family protein disulfide reductase n=1 Tax=Maribacter antarcticus TaxID=505250 RepID=UPI00047D4854|nr:TlpA disulfide reductase family protein [Maribacter antarcticus]
MKKKIFSVSNSILLVFLALLLIPQTRTPIQVAINRVKMLVLSPSAIDEVEQTQLQPFNYEVKDLNGTSTMVEVGMGRVAFLSYWATWCPPCIAELPSIQKLHVDYGDKMDFILLTNEDPAVVRRFLEKQRYKLPVYFPSITTPEVLYETSIPTNYIIDASGKIIIKETGAADWNSPKVRKLLDSLIAN